MTAAVSPAGPDEETLEAFRELFWAARNELWKSDPVSPDSPAYRAAVDFARSHGIPGADALLKASLSDFMEDGRRALGKAERACRELPAALAGEGHHVLGSVFEQLDRYEDAVKEYLTALAIPIYSFKSMTWFNIADAYDHLGEYRKAVEAYQKSIATAGAEPTGEAWYNLGNMYETLGEFENAAAAYNQALSDPAFDARGDALNNLGNVYDDLGRLDSAEDVYRQALAHLGDEAKGDVYFNLGLVLYKRGRSAEAEAAFEEVLRLPDSDHTHDEARAQLTVLRSDLTPEQLSPEDRAIGPRSTAVEGVHALELQLAKKFKSIGSDQYDRYMLQEGSFGRRPPDRANTLSVLRGWSSAVTLLEGSGQMWRGGGYFLKWRDKGIVIDPGFDFLRNFHDAGFHAREVHAVLVSHNHPDHNADLTRIDDLRYEVYKRRKRRGPDGSEFEDPDAAAQLAVLWDDDTARATRFAVPHRAGHRQNEIEFTTGLCKPDHTFRRPNGLPMSVTYFNVEHGYTNRDTGQYTTDVPKAVGFVLTLHLGDADSDADPRVGYTGDTRWFDDLPGRFKNCDVLIAHMSQPDPDELTDRSRRKDFHLGYRGVIDLVNAATPKLTLVGEFWAGLADTRIELVQGVRANCRGRNVLPAGIGLHLRLPSLEVECKVCLRPTSSAAVRVAPSASQYGNLAYLCEHCLLT